MFYIDGHCDSLSKSLDLNLNLNDDTLQFNFKKAKSIGGGIQITAAFIDPKLLVTENSGIDRCISIINKLNDYEKTNNISMKIKSIEDMEKTIKNNDIKVILSVENGSAISGNLNNIDVLHDMGVKIMSITWNDDNDLRVWCKNK